MEAVEHYLLFTWGTDFLALFFNFFDGVIILTFLLFLFLAQFFLFLFFDARLTSRRQ